MNTKTSNINTRAGLNWNTTIFMVIFHVGAIASLFMLSWKVVPVTILLWWISGSLGIGMGFHRLLTHRGYKTPKLVEYFLTLCGLLALKAAQLIGLSRTEYIMRILTRRVIRTPRGTGAGGHIWVGFCVAPHNSMTTV